MSQFDTRVLLYKYCRSHSFARITSTHTHFAAVSLGTITRQSCAASRQFSEQSSGGRNNAIDRGCLCSFISRLNLFLFFFHATLLQQTRKTTLYSIASFYFQQRYQLRLCSFVTNHGCYSKSYEIIMVSRTVRKQGKGKFFSTENIFKILKQYENKKSFYATFFMSRWGYLCVQGLNDFTNQCIFSTSINLLYSG